MRILWTENIIKISNETDYTKRFILYKINKIIHEDYSLHLMKKNND